MTDKVFEEPILSMDSMGLHIINAETAAKVEKKNISPSLVTSLEGCPARWLGETFVVNELVHEEDNAATRGSMFHRVMELFFKFPPEERTTKLMKEIIDVVLHEEDFSHFADNADAISWLRRAINGYYNMGAKPQKVKIAHFKDAKGREQEGLEVFVKGKIGKSKRDTLGFIDCLIEDPRDSESVIVQDWKTGGKVKKWNPKTKSDEGLGEARQQVIYSTILTQEYGLNVSGARLIFPAAMKNDEPAPQIVNIDIKDEDFNKKVVDSVEETDFKLDVMLETNTFDYKPSFLCAWCPLAKSCSAATIKPYEKMQTAFAAQPEPEILAEGIEF